jgi:hypothetical protein
VESCNLYIHDAVETLLVAEKVRHGGKNAFLGYMLAGTDAVAFDSTGFDPLQRRDRSITHKKVKDVAHHKPCIFGRFDKESSQRSHNAVYLNGMVKNVRTCLTTLT